MLGRYPFAPVTPLALSLVDNGPNDPALPPRGSRWRFWRRASAGPPAAEGRAWIHPSELPNFYRIPTYDTATPRRRRRPRLVLALGVMVLAAGSVFLILHSSSPPSTSSLGANVASNLSALPSYAQPAARSTIELVIADQGHITTTGALVISPGDLAITTNPIPNGASMTGASQSDLRFPVTLVSTDHALGFSIVHLGTSLPVAATSVLPASASVLALSPVFALHQNSPSFDWAQTTLGDPIQKVVNGVVSYMATASDTNLRGFPDTIAVDNQGNVVAVLSARNQWYSAEYIARVARAVTDNGGCHSHLGIVGEDAQGGGVLVKSVEPGTATSAVRPGDILTTFDGANLDSVNTLLSILYADRARSDVTLGVLRDGAIMTAHVILGCQP